MILTAKISFEEIGRCHISRYVIKNLFDNLTAKKIEDLTKLPLHTINYYRKTAYCIGDPKETTGYVYINFNHLAYINAIHSAFNLNHYCVLSMLQSHKFEITDRYIKNKLNLPNLSLINEASAFEIDWKTTAKKSKNIKITL